MTECAFNSDLKSFNSNSFLQAPTNINDTNIPKSQNKSKSGQKSDYIESTQSQNKTENKYNVSENTPSQNNSADQNDNIDHSSKLK